MKNLKSNVSLNPTRKLLLICLIIISYASLFAQKTEIDASLESKLIKPYVQYFQPGREWVYTHLNKSSYVQGDDMWFTSYVLNPSNRQLNLATSKLYVELWSPQKKLVSRNILFVKEGSSGHFIHLPDSLAPGSYCLRAYTNWMRNFYSEKDLSTFITILGNKKLEESALYAKTKSKSKDQNSITNNALSPAKDNGRDIQLLPESGILLEGADNVIGVKATDSFGRGIRITGKVFSGDNNEIAEVSTNEHGMGSFTIRETTNQRYILKADLPDSTKRDVELPKVEPKGITIQVNTFRADVISLRLQTNQTTSQINNTYFVTIHANGEMFGNYRFQFLKNNSIQFRINKKDLGSGIIYATVFDKNFNPVAERVFYNPDIEGRGSLVFKAEPVINDTIKMNVSVIDSLNKVDFTKLSISVLPGETQLSHFNNSLLVESILRPAVQGDIEDPNSYFVKNDFEHLAAINLLLLTQGWRKYDWQAILQNPAPTYKYPFETAFFVEGVVKNWLKNKTDANSKVSLFSPMNNLFLMAPVDKEGKYKFEKIFLADSTWVMVSATSEKGKNWNRAVQTDIPEYSFEAPDYIQKPIPPAKIKETPQKIPKLMKDAIVLSEVVIEGKKADPFSGNIYVSATDKIFEVTPENYRQFETVQNLLLIKFNVRTEYSDTSDGSSGHYFNVGRGALSIQSSEKDLQPLMTIDGMRVYDAQAILDLPLEYIEAVSVNKDGFGGGIGASGGIISIVTRKTPFFVNNAEATNMKKIMVHGYAKPKEYFTPKYNILPGTREYDKYAAIYWEPELTTDNKNNASFKFYVPREIKSLNIRAEGISVDGKMFLHEQKIELPGEN
jgi:hypothetical protein